MNSPAPARLVFSSIETAVYSAVESAMRRFHSSNVTGAAPALIPEVAQYAKGSKPAPNQKSLFGAVNPKGVNDAQGQKRLFEADGTRWITIGGHAEGGKKHAGGTPVQIDQAGNIVSGPQWLQDAGVTSLGQPGAGDGDIGEKLEAKKAEGGKGESGETAETESTADVGSTNASPPNETPAQATARTQIEAMQQHLASGKPLYVRTATHHFKLSDPSHLKLSQSGTAILHRDRSGWSRTVSGTRNDLLSQAGRADLVTGILKDIQSGEFGTPEATPLAPEPQQPEQPAAPSAAVPAAPGAAPLAINPFPTSGAAAGAKKEPEGQGGQPGQKQPWEMTKEDFEKDAEANGNPLKIKAHKDAEFYRSQIEEILRKRKMLSSPEAIEQVAKEYQMPDDRTYWDVIKAGEAAGPTDHRSAVESAMAAGKPVPPEVLADYPDLAGQQPQQAEQPSQQPPAAPAAAPTLNPTRSPAQQNLDLREQQGRTIRRLNRISRQNREVQQAISHMQRTGEGNFGGRSRQSWIDLGQKLVDQSNAATSQLEQINAQLMPGSELQSAVRAAAAPAIPAAPAAPAAPAVPAVPPATPALTPAPAAAPGIAGAQRSLFGGTDQKSGQKSLFNIAKPTKGKYSLAHASQSAHTANTAHARTIQAAVIDAVARYSAAHAASHQRAPQVAQYARYTPAKGQRSLFGADVGTEKRQEVDNAKGQKRLFAPDGGRWITIGGHAQGDAKHSGGTHVKIDGDGNILAGGKWLQDQGVTNLDQLGEGKAEGKGEGEAEAGGGAKAEGESEPEPAAEDPSSNVTEPEPGPKPALPQESPPEPAGVAKADSHPRGVMDRYFAITDRLDNGQISPEELKDYWKEFLASEDEIKSGFKKKMVDELRKMAQRSGDFYASRRNKGELVQFLFDGMASSLVPDTGKPKTFLSRESSIQVSGRYLEERATKEGLKEHAERFAAKKAERDERIGKVKAAIANPQTVDDFQTIIKYKGEGALTPEQRRAYDDLLATGRREKEAEKRSSVAAVAASNGLDIEIKEGFHAKKQRPTYVAVLNQRVERDQYDELNRKAKQLGGYYSAFKGNGAIPGFQFETREAAEQFKSLLSGDVNAAGYQEKIAEEMKAKISQSLSEKAASLAEQAGEDLGRDRLVNTHRRAAMAASAQGAARQQLAKAKTLEGIAKAMESGELKHLGGVRHATDIDTLNRVLVDSRYQQFTKANKENGHRLRWEEFSEAPQSEADIEAANYPYPKLWTNDLRDHAKAISKIPGLMRLAESLAKKGALSFPKKTQGNGYKFYSATAIDPQKFAESQNLQSLQMYGVTDPNKTIRVHKSADWRLPSKGGYTADLGKTFADNPNLAVIAAINAKNDLDLVDRPQESLIQFDDPREIGQLQTAASKLRGSKDYGLRRVAEGLADRLEHYGRLQRMDIRNPSELRAALREYLPLKSGTEKEDPIKAKERALIGQKIEGFFPTPRPLIDSMLDAAQIRPGMKVLEPSAGKGDILDAVKERAPEASTRGIEQHSELAQIGQMKGHAVEHGDFMSWSPSDEDRPDRIVMNPPFERGQDREHVQRAYDLLKPGGRLVAIMSEGPFFREQNADREFRNWLESVGGQSEQNPEGSFAGPDAFRQTGVQTRLVTIDKPEGAVVTKYQQRGGGFSSSVTEGAPAETAQYARVKPLLNQKSLFGGGGAGSGGSGGEDFERLHPRGEHGLFRLKDGAAGGGGAPASPSTAAPAAATPAEDSQPKNPWDMSADEFAKAHAGEFDARHPVMDSGKAKQHHARIISNRILDGDPVPPERIREYPFLDVAAMQSLAKRTAESLAMSQARKDRTKARDSQNTKAEPQSEESLHDERAARQTLEQYLSDRYSPGTVKKILNARLSGDGRRVDKNTGSSVSVVGGEQYRRHHDAVKNALSQGKVVPPEVLADYPHLAQRAPTADVGKKTPSPAPSMNSAPGAAPLAMRPFPTVGSKVQASAPAPAPSPVSPALTPAPAPAPTPTPTSTPKPKPPEIGVAGAQKSLFGGQDMKTGQKSLFNVALPSGGGKKKPDAYKLPSLRELGVIPIPETPKQSPSLPGQKSLYSLVGDAVARYSAEFERLHPRNDDGEFIPVQQIEAARVNRAAAVELRKEVTEPEEREKLDKMIGYQTARQIRGSQAPHVINRKRTSKGIVVAGPHYHFGASQLADNSPDPGGWTFISPSINYARNFDVGGKGVAVMANLQNVIDISRIPGNEEVSPDAVSEVLEKYGIHVSPEELGKGEIHQVLEPVRKKIREQAIALGYDGIHQQENFDGQVQNTTAVFEPKKTLRHIQRGIYSLVGDAVADCVARYARGVVKNPEFEALHPRDSDGTFIEKDAEPGQPGQPGQPQQQGQQGQKTQQGQPQQSAKPATFPKFRRRRDPDEERANRRWRLDVAKKGGKEGVMWKGMRLKFDDEQIADDEQEEGKAIWQDIDRAGYPRTADGQIDWAKAAQGVIGNPDLSRDQKLAELNKLATERDHYEAWRPIADDAEQFEPQPVDPNEPRRGPEEPEQSGPATPTRDQQVAEKVRQARAKEHLRDNRPIPKDATPFEIQEEEAPDTDRGEAGNRDTGAEDLPEFGPEEPQPTEAPETPEDFPSNVPEAEPAPEPQPEPQAPQQSTGRGTIGPGTASVSELAVDPNRFQYKLHTDNPAGVTQQFSDAKFNPELAGSIHVWEDPDDGKTYVVNGHHRFELAQRSGYDGPLQVYRLPAANATEARAKGALINIAGGNGTAIDAAKFMRDTGTTPEAMNGQHGVSLKGAVARDAGIMSKLSPGIFRRLTTGIYDEGRALAIAKHLPNHEDQDRLDKFVENAESKGREISPATVEEMAREAAMAGRQKQTTKSLFGDLEDDKNLFLERATLKGALRRDLSTRLNKFRAVATTRAAKTLEGKNRIDAQANRAEADRLAQFLESFDMETTRKGPVSDRLNRASQELASAPRKQKQILDSLARDLDALIQSGGAGGNATVSAAKPGAANRDDARGSGDPEELEAKPYVPAPGQRQLMSLRSRDELHGMVAAAVARYSRIHFPRT